VVIVRMGRSCFPQGIGGLETAAYYTRGMKAKSGRRGPAKTALEPVADVLRGHFLRCRVEDLVSGSREYPLASRVDLQRVLDELDKRFPGSRQLGIHCEYAPETLSLSHLLGNSHSKPVIGPLQYEEVDVGEALPARCIRQALWLGAYEKTRIALVIAPGPALRSHTRGVSRNCHAAWRKRRGSSKPRPR
jgi:hypothetical protein